MDLALLEAQAAACRGEVPIGAIVVGADGDILSRAGNETEAELDPSAHAEMLALRRAARHIGNKFLTDCDLYVTLEPCAMCAQAISLFRIRRLLFGAYDPKGGGVEHGPRVFETRACLHRPEVVGGVMQEACGAPLRAFFAVRR